MSGPEAKRASAGERPRARRIMKNTLWAFFLFLASTAFKGGWQLNRLDHVKMAKIKMSLVYLRCIKTSRLLFLGVLNMGICLVFILTGLVLLHLSLFLYAPWSAATKMLVGILCSLAYLAAALIMISQIFVPDKWLKIFHADTLAERLHQEPHGSGKREV